MRTVIAIFLGLMVAWSIPADASQTSAGRVQTVTATATASRDGQVVDLKVGDQIFEADILRTGAESALGVVLKDNTELSLGPFSEIAVDEFVLAPEAEKLSLLTKMTKGTCAYVSGKIAKISNEKVKFETPLGIIGIRGTKFLVKVYDRQRADNVLIIFDYSASMNEMYRGNYKRDLAKQVARRINQAFPDLEQRVTPGLKLKAGVRAFMDYNNYTVLLSGMSDYSKEGIEDAVRSLNRKANGETHVDYAIQAAIDDVRSLGGKSAVILVSDGKFDAKDAQNAAQTIKRQGKDNLCVYPVLIGDDPEGRENMARLIPPDGCGFVVTDQDLSAPRDFNAYARQMILCDPTSGSFPTAGGNTGACERGKQTAVVLLPDLDGAVGEIAVSTTQGSTVINQAQHETMVETSDAAPSQPALVSENQISDTFGSTLEALSEPKARYTLLFDKGSTVLTAESKSAFGSIIAAIKSRGEPLINIEGHADREGSSTSNWELSRKRALQVNQLLASAGIASDAMDLAYYGEQAPVIKTADNLAEPKNRRVEITVR